MTSYVHSLEECQAHRDRSRPPACIGMFPKGVLIFHIYCPDLLIDMSAFAEIGGSIGRGWDPRALASIPPREVDMSDPSRTYTESQRWSAEALAIAAQAKVLSGNKLEQLVVRLQRHSGRSHEACWRFIIQHGIKGKVDHRRWTEKEIETVREELVRHSVDEIASRIGRTTKSVRRMLQRNGLLVRDIRCDLFSLENLAQALRVRKSEILSWIERGWLQAAVHTQGKRRFYSITPEALAQVYKHHLADLLKRGIPNQALFEAYIQYVHSPKHTVGEQLLDVRRDKKERAAFAATAERRQRDQLKEGDEHDEHMEEDRIGRGKDDTFHEVQAAASE